MTVMVCDVRIHPGLKSNKVNVIVEETIGQSRDYPIANEVTLNHVGKIVR